MLETIQDCYDTPCKDLNLFTEQYIIYLTDFLTILYLHFFSFYKSIITQHRNTRRSHYTNR